MPVDGRSDIFSAGVILYQFLTGERPFSGSSTTTMQKVLKEDPLPPSTLNVQLPDAIDAVVRKALAKRPEERYQTAADFASDLRAAVGPRAAHVPLPTRAIGDAQVTELNVAAPTVVVPAAQASGIVADGVSGSVPPAPAYVGGSSAPAQRSQTAAIALVLAIAFVAVVAGLWVFFNYGPGQPQHPTTAQTSPPKPPVPAVSPSVPSSAATPATPAQTVAVAPASVPAAPVATNEPPGSVVIAAQGIADPSNPRYQNNPSQLQADLRADAKSQLVAKALGLLVEPASLAKNYDVLRERVIAKSPGFIGAVMRESEPRVGKDGLVSMTTEAVVNVKEVQKSLNQMTRDERIQLIRASGNPRIALRIAVYDADRPDAPPRPSPIAENLIKDRVKTFGFRTWAEASDKALAGDFIVAADAKVKRLTTRLEASGITVTKYAVTALTVKCIDQATGEEIYFKSVLPKGTGSFATEEEALAAIGGRVADEFSRDFFLQHVYVSGQRVTLVVNGLPDANAAELIGRELVSLPAVIAARSRAGAKSPTWDLQLAGGGAAGDLVAGGVVAPVNAKLGQACLSPGAVAGDEVQLMFDQRCADPAVLSRLETHPPAGLYNAPPSRQKSVISNPETLRKLTI